MSIAKQNRLILVGVALLVVFGPGVYVWARLSWDRLMMDRRIRALQARHDRLKQNHERLTTDPAYMEGLVRSTFKVAKPGELVISLDPTSEVPSKR